MMAVNKANCQPTWREVWARYQTKYGKEPYDLKVEEEFLKADGEESDDDE